MRLALAYCGIQLLWDNWIFGIGPFLINEGMSTKIKELFNDQTFHSLLNTANNKTLEGGSWITHPHLAFLNLWLGYGIISLIFYFDIFKITKQAFLLRKNIRILLLPLSGMSICFVHNTFFPQTLLTYLFFYAIVIKYYVTKNRTHLVARQKMSQTMNYIR